MKEKSHDRPQRRAADRGETARHSDLIEGLERAPSQGSRSGHQIGNDIATQDELKQEVGDGSVTRARDSDKGEEANLPRFNESN